MIVRLTLGAKSAVAGMAVEGAAVLGVSALLALEGTVWTRKAVVDVAVWGHLEPFL